MSDDGVIVLGGGLAGLSTAFHFGRRCQVFEAEDVAGGLLRTREKEGYLFDYTGHLLHVRDRYAEDFIKGLLKGNLVRHTRRAAVFSKGTYTRYPFQANAYGLPEDVASECVGGFEKARREIGEKRPGSFGEWITANFGEGIARHFMLPYNRKLWRYPLEDMAVEGVEPFVPVPTVEDARRGATEEGATGLGYNASFYYPERGGIYSLVEAMLPHVRELSLGQRAIDVDMALKRTFPIYREWKLALEADMANIANHATYGVPSCNVTKGSEANFCTITSMGAGYQPREVQVSGRISW